ncbi:MAG: Dihydroorotate oxidase [Proteobacteria bacterium]|nr:Dihydroorotate oxidase [Pseudomonadota bacterium]
MPDSLIRKLLFALDPETAHRLAMNGIDFINRAGIAGLLAKAPPSDPVRVMGIDFPNPVGLAAGFDKDGEHVDALAALGFGFIEIGTVTPRPQPGNPKPRLFRVGGSQAIINRLGGNSCGVDQLLAHLASAQFARRGGIVGINVGKNFDTPSEKAADDYLIGVERVYGAASYIAINISGANNALDTLDALLSRLKAEQARLTDKHGKYVPLAIKIAADLDDGQIQSIADRLRAQRIDGAIATTTTLARDGVDGLPNASEAGGLSGAPLFEKSTRVLGKLARALAGEVAIIGVGGIVSGADAQAKIDAGASLVQLYSGLVYRGPGLIAEAAAAIAKARKA